jgi:hypothetical protein
MEIGSKERKAGRPVRATNLAAKCATRRGTEEVGVNPNTNHEDTLKHHTNTA